MPNFSSLAGLEVPEKFGVGWGGVVWGGFQVITMSNPTKLLLSCFELSSVGFRQLTAAIWISLEPYCSQVRKVFAQTNFCPY